MQTFSYTDISFYLYFFFFVIAILLSFWLPGVMLLKKVPMPNLYKVLLSPTLGIVLWAFQGLLFGYLHMRVLTNLYVVFFFLISLFYNRTYIVTVVRSIQIKWNYFSFVILTLILLGGITQYSSIWQMGMRTTEGVIFCCRSVPDDIYHLALTDSLLHSFPPSEPGMSGQIVHNYHYLSNLVIADFVRVFHFPLIITQAQFFPLFFSLLLGVTVLFFGLVYKLPKWCICWLLFFIYFHSDILYILMFFFSHRLDITQGFFDDGTKLASAPPFISGMILLFASMAMIGLWLREKSLTIGIIAAVLLGGLTGFKIYCAIFGFVGLFSLSVYLVISDRKIKHIIPLLIAFCIACSIFIPVITSPGGFVFAGFWRSNNFIMTPQLHLSYLEMAKMIYDQHNNWLHSLFDNIYFTALYLMCILGTLLISFFQTKKTLKLLPVGFHIFLLSGILFTGFLGLFTLQKTGDANTVQFLVVILFIVSIYAALATKNIITFFPRYLGLFFCVVILLLTIPRGLYDSYINYSASKNKDIFLVTNKKLDDLRTITSLTNEQAIVAIDMSHEQAIDYYLPLFLNRKIYLVGSQILVDHAVNVQSRMALIQLISHNTIDETIATQMRKENISYVLYTLSELSPLTEKSSYMQLVYRGNSFVLYKRL